MTDAIDRLDGRGGGGTHHEWHIHANSHDQGREIVDKINDRLRVSDRGRVYRSAATSTTPTYTA